MKTKIFKTVIAIVMALSALMLCLVGCKKNEETGSAGDAASGQYADTITMVWYPNESAEDYETAREEFAALITQATGKKVEHQLTTDYAVAIEAMATGKAQICFYGAEGYVQSHAKNSQVLPLFVNSGESGTLEDAIYYSFLAVEADNAADYQDGDSYSIDSIEGKSMSFVSNSSTSGFTIPTTSILSHFADKNLDLDTLLEGGEFFSEVLFSGSHQGSAYNLMSGKAEVAAFCDTEIKPYADCTEGQPNTVGAVYTIKYDATAPFDTVQGEQFVIIQCTPVLNGPFGYNADTLDPADVKAIQDLFTSDAVTNNEKIFVPEDSDAVGMFARKGSEKFVLVDDSWYDPIRNMGQ